jgi:hypothetical protein
LRDEWGLTLGRVWLADTNLVAAGGVNPAGRPTTARYSSASASMPKSWPTGAAPASVPIPPIQRRRHQRRRRHDQRVQRHYRPATALPLGAVPSVVRADVREGRTRGRWRSMIRRRISHR